MNLAPGTRTTTIESKTNFLGAAPVNTRVTAEFTPLHRGKTTQVWQTMIRSEAGKLCAVVTQTQMVRRPDAICETGRPTRRASACAVDPSAALDAAALRVGLGQTFPALAQERDQEMHLLAARSSRPRCCR